MMVDASSASSCDGSSCVPHEFTQANRCFLNVFSLMCLAIAACRAAYTFCEKNIQSARLHAQITEQGMRVAKSNAELDLMRGFKSFLTLMFAYSSC